MVRQTSKRTTEIQVVRELVELESDCLAAMGEAAQRAADVKTRSNFLRMAAECEEHMYQWRERLHILGGAPAQVNHSAAWFNRVKVRVASPFGRRAVALAVMNNPTSCITAYAQTAAREDLQAPTRNLAKRMRRDAMLQRAVIRKISR